MTPEEHKKLLEDIRWRLTMIWFLLSMILGAFIAVMT